MRRRRRRASRQNLRRSARRASHQMREWQSFHSEATTAAFIVLRGLRGCGVVDGERAYGDAATGIVACSACGIGRNYWSLEDDAWAPHHVAALCLGGNGRLRNHLEKVGASDPAVSAPYVSAYAEHLAVAACDAVKASLDYEAHWLDDEESSMRNRRDACVKLVATPIESRDVKAAEDERAVELRTNEGKLGLELAEVHGGRCAVIKCSAWTEAVRPGDYVVAVGEKRCWRYAPVVKAISKAKKRGIVKLLLRRVAVVEHPELAQKEAPPTSATNEAWASQKQNGSQSKVQSYCAFRRPCTPRRRRVAARHAAHAMPRRPRRLARRGHARLEVLRQRGRRGRRHHEHDATRAPKAGARRRRRARGRAPRLQDDARRGLRSGRRRARRRRQR